MELDLYLEADKEITSSFSSVIFHFNTGFNSVSTSSMTDVRNYCSMWSGIIRLLLEDSVCFSAGKHRAEGISGDSILINTIRIEIF